MSWTKFGTHWRVRNERRTVRLIDGCLVIEDDTGRSVMEVPMSPDRLRASTGTVEEVMEAL